MSGINDSSFKRNIDIISNNQPSKTKSINLKTITFNEIVPKNKDIDYISIDIEGGEMNLLKSIDFKTYNILNYFNLIPTNMWKFIFSILIVYF